MSQRADRIKREIPLDRVLSEYGYAVYQGSGEQQFSCDLHGDGSDSSPSARFYPDSNSFYCFACGKARDSIGLVMEKEGLEFAKACSALERKYGLDEWIYKAPKDPFKRVESPGLSDLELIQKNTERKLKMLTLERALPYDTMLKLWEGFDLLCSLETTTIGHWKKLLSQMKGDSD